MSLFKRSKIIVYIVKITKKQKEKRNTKGYLKVRWYVVKSVVYGCVSMCCCVGEQDVSTISSSDIAAKSTSDITSIELHQPSSPQKMCFCCSIQLCRYSFSSSPASFLFALSLPSIKE